MRVFTETRCGSAPAAQDGCPGRTGPRDVDVCLIVEGCYPYRRGGVSNWIDTLLADQSNVNFAVISIQPAQATVPVLYTARSNIRLLQRLELGSIHVSWRWQARRREACQAIANEMVDFIRWGSLQNLQRLIRMCKALAGQRNLSSFVQSKIGWESACVIYRALAPAVSFRDFYWSWRVLFGGLFAVLDHPLPNAAAFHAVSTGFAGLLAARARIETGRPAIPTEHGIYTTERMIELFMAQWITEDLDLSLSVQDDRMSLRSFWIRCFESFARACYEASSLIISLFPENQVSQKELGADAAKLRIVPNGVRWQD